MKGRLITVEGIDGVGKTTQVELLGLKLTSLGYPILFTKEPGSALGGPDIRKLLFESPTTNKMYPGQADCLYLYDHIGHVEGIIKPALEQGIIVLSDRYADSQFAYSKSSKRQTTPSTMAAFKDLYGIVPDVTIFLYAVIKDSSKAWTIARALNRKGPTQRGKMWGADIKEQLIIQEAYVAQLANLARTITIPVYEEDSAVNIAEKILCSVTSKLSAVVE